MQGSFMLLSHVLPLHANRQKGHSLLHTTVALAVPVSGRVRGV